ncbi:MAG: DUF2752 domain-containing protein [Candidatus Nanopelagicales bacterium]
MLSAAPTTAARNRRLLGPAAAALATGSAWAAVAVWRPGDGGPGPCPWKWLTGLDCPFCGATRAAAELAHGHVLAALDHNAFFVLVILPVALYAWGRWALAAWRGQRVPVLANRTVYVGLGVTLAWWVLRLSVSWLGSGLSG